MPIELGRAGDVPEPSRPVPLLERRVSRDGGAVLGNAAANTVSQVANLVVPVVTYPYLMRALGAERFGGFALAQAVVSYGVLLVDYGFNLSATRRLASAPLPRAEVSALFWNVLAAKGVLAVCGGCAVVAATCVVPKLSAISDVILATLPALVGAVMFPQWLFQGLERMALGAACLVVARVALLCGTFALVHRPEDAWVAALVQSLSMAVAGAVAAWMIGSRRLIGWVAPTWQGVGAVLTEGWHVFTSVAATTLYGATNVVLLGLVAGNASVGVFAALDKVRLMCQGVLTPLSNAAYPRVNKLMAEDRARAGVLVRWVMAAQAGMTAAIALVLVAAAPHVVRAVLGYSHPAATLTLRLMAFVPLAVSFSNVLGIQIMLPLGLQRQFSRVLLAAGAMNVAIFVPLAAWKQEVGAAASLLMAESCVALMMAATLALEKRRRGGARG